MNLFKSSLIVALGTILSRFIGLYRDHLLASTFGAGNSLDIYYAAFRIPDFVYNLFILGTLTAAFIPIFNRQLVKNEDAANKLTNNVLNLGLIGMSILCALLWIFAGFLTKYLVPGFPAEKLASTVEATRLLLLSPIIFTASSLLAGFLQSKHKFVATSLAPVFYNLGIIGGIFWAKINPSLGIRPLLWGVILGASLHLLTQATASMLSGYSWRPIVQFKDPATREVLKLFLPKIFGLDSSQVSLIITAVVGSFLLPGTIALYNLSSNIQAVPVGVFAVSLAITSFPMLSKFFAQRDESSFFSTFSKTLTVILTILIPVSLIFIVYRFQIMNILFGSGKFSNTDVILTGQGLLFFALSIPFQGLISVIARSFYARGSTLIPVIWSGAALITNAFFAILLGPKLGVAGLAIAFSLSVTVQFVGLFVNFILFSKKQIDKTQTEIITRAITNILKHTGNLLISVVIFSLTLLFIKFIFESLILTQSRGMEFINIVISSGISSLLLLWLLSLFKNPVISELKQSASKLLKSA